MMVKTGSLVVCNKLLNMIYFDVKYLYVKVFSPYGSRPTSPAVSLASGPV
jgi:hypothetical protein